MLGWPAGRATTQVAGCCAGQPAPCAAAGLLPRQAGVRQGMRRRGLGDGISVISVSSAGLWSKGRWEGAQSKSN